MTKNNHIAAILILAGIIGATACSSEAENKPAGASTSGQSGTVESFQATDDSLSLSTEEAGMAREESISATETLLTIMITDTQISSPTLSPQPTPESTPTATPPTYHSPFSNPVPIQWEREVGNLESVIVIEKIVGDGFFSGYLLEPTLGNKYAVNGKIVEEINEYELGKWEQIEGFNSEMGGTWIRFTNYSVLEGSGSTDQLFLAHINEEGFMKGNFFWNKNTYEPFDTFELFLVD